MEEFEVKSISHEIKALDEEKGIVEAYANVYNFEDSDGDISAPGSFKRTVNNNAKRIKVLKDHLPHVKLGVPLELDAEDSYGLRTVTQFNMQKAVSRDMYYDIKLDLEKGMNAELSIGYQTMKRDSSNKKIITEYKLYEYSFLSAWGANERSVATGAKSYLELNHKARVDEATRFLTEMFNLKYSDERLQRIEQMLESLHKDSEQNPLIVNPTLSKSDILKELTKPFEKYGY